MLIRREGPTDHAAVRAVTARAFDGPVEAALIDALRADPSWLPPLSLVADLDGTVAGHVLCTRGAVADRPALGLGPISVHPEHQRAGVGSALMHAVLGAADALGEPLVALLGNPEYYSRFGFEPAARYDIHPQVAGWEPYFQVRPLSAYSPTLRGEFTYPAPFPLD